MNKFIVILPLSIAVVFLIFPFIVYFGNDIMVVTSDSMLPTLKPNDLIVIQKAGISEITVGDIITFNSHIETIGIVAHRVVEIYDDGDIAIRTQGDNVDEEDTWVVHDEDLIGKVHDHLSYFGILLVDPIRYSLVAVIIITAISLLREITSETKLQKNK